MPTADRTSPFFFGRISITGGWTISARFGTDSSILALAASSTGTIEAFLEPGQSANDCTCSESDKESTHEPACDNLTQ
jgi:hypothetical protein